VDPKGTKGWILGQRAGTVWTLAIWTDARPDIVSIPVALGHCVVLPHCRRPIDVVHCFVRCPADTGSSIENVRIGQVVANA
jgi:hypothetical protein